MDLFRFGISEVQSRFLLLAALSIDHWTYYAKPARLL